ncbi:tailspike protein [Vibrio phage 1.275.O._10N.286.54.E11]|nr:tailspike protein [Vibrio phage 1.275.O._10N.286.54.E11]
MANIIALPYEYFANPAKSGPLFNAQIYIGVADTDPLIPANRVDVFYVQEDNTEVILPQPIRTNSGGLTVNGAGEVVQIRTANDYSMRVFDRQGAEITQYNIPNNSESGGATQLYVRERVSDGSSQLSGGLIFPQDSTVSLQLGAQSTQVPQGVSRLRVNTGSAVEVLLLWEPSGDFSSINQVVTDISLNQFNEYVVTASSGSYSFTTETIRRKRGQEVDFTSIDFDVSAIGFGYPTNKDSNDVDVASFVNATIGYVNENRAGTVVLPSSVVSSNTDKITVFPGVHLKGAALPQTFDNFRTSTTITTIGTLTESDGTTAAPVIEIGEGTNNSSQRNRGMHVQGIKVIAPAGGTAGVGFSSVNTNFADFTQSAFYFRMTDNVAENLLIGFRYRNSWNLEISKNAAIRCDVGHRYDGDVTSGGTSSLFSANLSYLCRIGHDFQATGWTYTEFVGCGSDGCEVAARFTGASYRGFSLKNFGFENADSTSGVGVGILVNNGNSGVLDIDGLLCGIHDDPNVIFINVLSCQKLNIRNTDVGSSVINSGKILNIPTPNDVGRVTIEDSDWFGDSIADNIGDVFLAEVTLINTRIAGRLYAHATGGLDIKPQRIAYASGSTNYEAVDRDNKQIHSVTMLCDTNNEGSSRFIAGTPAFDTSQIPDGTIIEFVNSTSASSPSAIGLRSEDAGVGVTGIVRDPAINTPSSIVLTNPGDRAKFQKRSDGKLYQLTLEQAGV